MPAQQPLHLFSEEETEIRSKAAHILVADDDPSLVRLLQEFLEIEGYTVLCAYDGQMALRLVQEHSVDLIILDINMPMTSGLKVFQQLRAMAGTAKIPVIFVTGELSKDVYPAIADAQRVAHVKKPLDLESFNSLIRLFLQQYPNQ
jgi:CheY-like chemotaxis protein